ncbi:MAG: SemiSWEET family transporter [bacterium]|nr:SemiSWEET family transporter [bacterium]
MINPEIFGYVATFLNVIMMIPQVHQTSKTKNTKGLSLQTLFIFITASFFWLLYGIEKGALPIIITNCVVAGMNMILVMYKLKYK